MSANSLSVPFPIFNDIDGDPLDAGYIYIGTANLDPVSNPINVYFDEALTIPASQPIRTLNGFPSNSGSPARLYVNADDYSITVKNKNSSQVYTSPVSTDAVSISRITGLYYATVSEMVADSISSGAWIKTKGYTTSGDGKNATYLVKTAAEYGSTPDEVIDHTLANGNVAVFQRETADAQYSTLGSDVSGTLTFSHSAGSAETQTTTVTTESKKLYLFELDATTTAEGYVKILLDDTEIFFGDQTNGFWFSNATILTDGTENNRILNTTTYSFVFDTINSTYSQIKLVTDTAWAGTVNSVSVKEITPQRLSVEIAPDDAPDSGVLYGLRTPDKYKNDIVLGDIHSLVAQQTDAGLVGAHNVALGAYALSATQFGDQNTAVGTFALQGNEGSNNTAVGYSALKLNNKGQENTAVGYKAGTTNTTGYKNVYMGFWAGNRNKTGLGNVVVGWQNNTAGASKSYNTALGYNAGSGYNGIENTFVGASSGQSVSGQEDITAQYVTGIGAETKPIGDGATAVGFQASCGSEGATAPNSVAVGRLANADGTNSISIGYQANSQSTGSVAIGDVAVAGADGAIGIGDGTSASGSRSIGIGGAASANGSQSVAVGALATPSGNNIAAVGFRALNNFTGSANTAIGHTAGLQAAVAYTNCTLLGSLTTVTGSNQVQLGDSSTTTYAYGAVQNRSDARDKLDVQSLPDALLAFFMEVEWKQFRFNYRESYIDIDEETGERIERENDGSRAGSRFHIGAIAQQVEAAMKKHGVDFAGLQYHAIAGGEDIYSIGYQEFIGIQGEIIQRQQKRLDLIEARLSAAGI